MIGFFKIPPLGDYFPENQGQFYPSFLFSRESVIGNGKISFLSIIYKFTSLRANFINVLRAAFTLADPSARKTVKLSVFFVLLGSTCAKSCLYNVDEIDIKCYCRSQT